MGIIDKIKEMRRKKNLWDKYYTKEEVNKKNIIIKVVR